MGGMIELIVANNDNPRRSHGAQCGHRFSGSGKNGFKVLYG